MTKARANDKHILGDNTQSNVDRMGAANRLATDGDTSIEPTVREWLHADLGALRAQAINCLLGYLGLAAYVDDGLRMLREDRDDEARQNAAHALRFYVLQQGLRAREITRALARAALTDESELVASIAYASVVDSVLRPGESPTMHDFARGAFDTALLKKVAEE